MASKKSFPNSKRGGGGTDYGLTGHSGGMDPDAEIPEYAELRFSEVKARDEMDLKMGFYRHTEGNEPKLGWLVNMHPTLSKHSDCLTGKSAIDLYFLEEDGGHFKATVFYDPYFYVICKPGSQPDVEEYIRRRFSKSLLSVNVVSKEDLKLPNHLLQNRQSLLKLTFHNVQDLMNVRKGLFSIVEKNKLAAEAGNAYDEMAEYMNHGKHIEKAHSKTSMRNAADNILDLREYDVPYYVRAAIDMDFRVGLWYNVKATNGKISLELRPDLVKRAEPVVLAFDIETTKLPLKFPDAAFDQIMMISYMIDGQGFLITNREIVSEDINDFEYSPNAEYEGLFTIFNEANEKDVLKKFFQHIRDVQPTVFVTYNGDFFDWPFIDNRAQFHGLDLLKEIGYKKEIGGEYKSFYSSHLDCFCWVKRDSYLPQGSQGLKAVTKAKLGYNPMEIDPEDMTRFASEEPQTLAQYSVSDAVATYYLYMKYVNPFIFSLCNIIPMSPDDVLRKGSGTLCETLLMVQSYKADVIMPNKHVEQTGKMYDGRLIDSETYVGGHVEALEAGVFRSDIPTRFKVVPEAIQQLIDEVDMALEFSIKVEGNLKMSDISNYDEIRSEIISKLESLRNEPLRNETPLIYHLDVAAMYPNIILTNRLQPDAMVDDRFCASCDFNEGPDSTCQRKMQWSWRGEIFQTKRNEYNMLINQLENERFPVPDSNETKAFHELRKSDQNVRIKQRVTDYSKKVYGKLHETKVVERESTVCQRENPFYINTVRSFRDRRYEYKGLHKTWKKKLDEAQAEEDAAKIDEAKKMIVVYDSLQLAHKCILNSFYGYVMRKGARWYSMEMAGIVCLTGAKIIQLARSRIEQIGRPLELDTDGIWCIFPSSFPENFKLKLNNGKVYPISYPCVMLNHLVHAQFTNHQYQELQDPVNFEYSTRSENSIFFEVDGPYKAMILPASKEADKLLKKRYAVFNEDGSIAELKGFELKRRGELKLIKIFQSQLFQVFLEGTTLEECYDAVASVANKWLDILFSKAADLEDEELFDLISENRSMSKSLKEYGAQKSTSISTAKRLAEFLGDQMVKDKGLNCKFVISAKPVGVPVSERAVPVAIFQSESSVKKHYLRKWLNEPSLVDFDIRSILDWGYYTERFSSVIQKLITIPAAMQKVSNPVPRIRHPDWLLKRTASTDDKTRQYRITEMFSKKAHIVVDSAAAAGYDSEDMDMNNHDDDDIHLLMEDGQGDGLMDMEDFGSGVGSSSSNSRLRPPVVTSRKRLHQDSARAAVAATKPATLAAVVEEDEPDYGEMPDPQIDYSGWLVFQKRKWKKQKIARRQRAQMIVDSGGAGQLGAGNIRSGPSIANFFRQENIAILSGTWEVLEIVQTDMPGEFRIFAIVNQTMHSFRLIIPRIIYINNRTEDTSLSGSLAGMTVEKCSSILPRSHPSFNLYRLTMSERVYLSSLPLLTSVYTHQDVEGVYEAQVPLLFRALINLGARVSVKRTSGRELMGIDEGFELEDLNKQPLDSKQYLRDYSINYLTLFHTKAGSRQTYALFSSCSETVHVAYVDAARNLDQIPNMERYYRERFDRYLSGQQEMKDDLSEEEFAELDSSKVFQYSEHLDFQTRVFSTDAQARAHINKCLQEHKDDKKGPTILVIGSPLAASHLMDGIFMIRDFPCKQIALPQTMTQLDAIGWQTQSIRKIMALYFTVEQWLGDQIQLANYADVPLCNIENDWSLALMDLFLARKLQKQDMVLWYSPSEKPDLGGRQEDENRSVLTLGSDIEINLPGSYNNVTLDISLSNLAFNTIVQAALVNEMEGCTTSLGNEPQLMDAHLKGKPHMLSSNYNQLNPNTFSIIRNMVKSWWMQMEAFRNMPHLVKWHSSMLQNFHRWLKSTGAKLHDPALLQMVNDLMKKVFLQLLAQLKKLGSEIVFANFERILVSTSKRSLVKASTYATFLTDSIKNKPVLSLLELEVTRMWEHLHWLDSYNVGGFYVDAESTATALTASGVDGGGSGFDEEDGNAWLKKFSEEQLAVTKKEMTWNISLYLPPACRKEFNAFVSDYLDMILTFADDFEDQENNGFGGGGGVNSIQLNKSYLSKKTEYLQKSIKHSLKRRLLEVIPNIHRKWLSVKDNEEVDETLRNKYLFPKLPGSHLDLQNPALELVKYLCTVIGLDKELEWEVGILKKDLLLMIGIKQFSGMAKYENPCERCIMSVICSYCGKTKELDLTRDPDVEAAALEEAAAAAAAAASREGGGEGMQDEEQMAAAAAAAARAMRRKTSWRCDLCTTEYDRSMIEHHMINAVQKYVQQWYLQDLQCKRCKGVNMYSIREHCYCSGFLEPELKSDEFATRIRIFKNVAEYYGLDHLKEVVAAHSNVF